MTELFRSDAVKVDKSEVNGWKTFTFKRPKKLKKGKYLVGIGQSKIQGFVAFRSGVAKQDYKSKLWSMMPIKGLSDGNSWSDMADLVKSMGATEAELKQMENAVILMKLEYK